MARKRKDVVIDENKIMYIPLRIENIIRCGNCCWIVEDMKQERCPNCGCWYNWKEIKNV